MILVGMIGQSSNLLINDLEEIEDFVELNIFGGLVFVASYSNNQKSLVMTGYHT